MLFNVNKGVGTWPEEKSNVDLRGAGLCCLGFCFALPSAGYIPLLLRYPSASQSFTCFLDVAHTILFTDGELRLRATELPKITEEQGLEPCSWEEAASHFLFKDLLLTCSLGAGEAP